MARQSQPSNFDDENAEKLPEVGTSRDYKHCHPELIKRFIALTTEFSNVNPGRALIVTCTYRSVAEQSRLYAQGRNGNLGAIVTNCDGKRNPSKHNVFPARAIDVCVLVGGKTTWDEKDYWPILPLAKKHGLVHGGSWVKFPDWPHVQLPDDVG